MPDQSIEFTNQAGEKLAGRLIVPLEGEPKAYAVFAHCFTCTKNLSATRNIARALAGEGIATFIFDFTGLGNSEGEFSDSNFSSNVDDLIAAANYLSEHFEAPKIMAGHSLGGTAALKAAAQIPSVIAVASIASPANPAHISHLLTQKREEIESAGVAEVSLGGRPFSIKRQFLEDIENHSVLDVVAHFKKALLVMHAPMDDTVDMSNATEIFIAAKHPKSFVSLDNADHLLSRKEDSEYAGRIIAAWASRYIEADETASPYPDAGSHGAAARTRGDGFKTYISAGGHAMLADEPVSVGGSNLGPSPFDLLSSALAACTTMTLKMYADHKKIALDSTTCHVIHSKTNDSDGNKINLFKRKLSVSGELTQKQRERMLEIANRCPVHKALSGRIEIESELASE